MRMKEWINTQSESVKEKLWLATILGYPDIVCPHFKEPDLFAIPTLIRWCFPLTLSKNGFVLSSDHIASSLASVACLLNQQMTVHVETIPLLYLFKRMYTHAWPVMCCFHKLISAIYIKCQAIF